MLIAAWLNLSTQFIHQQIKIWDSYKLFLTKPVDFAKWYKTNKFSLLVLMEQHKSTESINWDFRMPIVQNDIKLFFPLLSEQEAPNLPRNKNQSNEKGETNHLPWGEATFSTGTSWLRISSVRSRRCTRPRPLKWWPAMNQTRLKEDQNRSKKKQKPKRTKFETATVPLFWGDGFVVAEGNAAMPGSRSPTWLRWSEGEGKYGEVKGGRGI